MTPKRSQRVLIVDDDTVVLKILAKILLKKGYDVDTAQSGQEALTKIEAESCAAAIIDVKLQDMNGLDLLDRLQAIAPCMTKIILTGYPSDEDRIRAIRQGADHYFAKPVRSEELIDTLEDTLEKHKMHLTRDLKKLSNMNPTSNHPKTPPERQTSGWTSC